MPAAAIAIAPDPSQCKSVALSVKKYPQGVSRGGLHAVPSISIALQSWRFPSFQAEAGGKRRGFRGASQKLASGAETWATACIASGTKQEAEGTEADRRGGTTVCTLGPR